MKQPPDKSAGTWQQRRGQLLLLLLVAGTVLLATIALQIKTTLPPLSELREIEHHQSSRILSADGELLGSWFVQNRTDISLEQVSTHFIDAVIAVEDIRFYEHNGIDRRALLRVLVKSLLLRQDTGGGSTITQQLAKNLYPREKSGTVALVTDKLREAITARRLEQLYSKEEILELYLNTVSFGEETFGIETASRRFFNRSATDLELHQAATLAGLLRAPGAYNPNRYPERAEARRNLVLRQMERAGSVKPDQAELAIRHPLGIDYNRITINEGPAPHFREHLRVELQRLLREQPAADGRHYNLYTDGLIIQTTIDAGLQKMAEEALRNQIMELQNSITSGREDSLLLPRHDPAVLQAWQRSEHYRHLVQEGTAREEIEAIFETPRPMKVFTWQGETVRELSSHDSLRHYLSFLNGGFVALSPENGEVKAWAGGIRHDYFQYDHVKSRRQTGSSFKPFLYAAALESGVKPCDYRRNMLSSYEAWEEWTPRNVQEEYGGSWSVQAALARSINTISVDLLMETGLEQVRRSATEMGIQNIPAEPSIALGSSESSLIEMVRGYAVFASGGRRIEPRTVRSIHDSDGRLLYSFDPNPSAEREWVISPETASAMINMLSKAVDEGSGAPLRTRFGLSGPLAGKTGTTQGYTDGWFIGMTPDLVFGAWTGAATPRIRFSGTARFGSQTALPIAGRFLAAMESDRTEQPRSFHTHQQNNRYDFSCPDHREDSTLDRFRDFLTGQSSDEPRRVRAESENRNLGDRIRNLFGRE